MKKKWINPQLETLKVLETRTQVPQDATCRHYNWASLTGQGIGPRPEHGECQSTGQANGSQENQDSVHYLPKCPYLQGNYCKLFNSSIS